jgi:hypothetical protein
MTYLTAVPRQTVFESRVHHFYGRATAPRMVESPSSRIVIVCARSTQIHALLANWGAMKVAAVYELAIAMFPLEIVSRLHVGEPRDFIGQLKGQRSDPEKEYSKESVYVVGSLDRRYDATDAQLMQDHLGRHVVKLDQELVVHGARPTSKAGLLHRRQGQRDYEDVLKMLPSVGCMMLEPREGSRFPRRS